MATTALLTPRSRSEILLAMSKSNHQQIPGTRRVARSARRRHPGAWAPIVAKRTSPPSAEVVALYSYRCSTARISRDGEWSEILSTSGKSFKGAFSRGPGLLLAIYPYDRTSLTSRTSIFASKPRSRTDSTARICVPNHRKERGVGTSTLHMIAGTDQGEINTGDFQNLQRCLDVLAKADPVVPIKPGEWFTEEVIADGDIITVIVQGIEVVKFKLLHRKLTSGAIGLICRGNSRVVFRKIEIKELKGAGVGGSPASGGESEKVPETVDWGRMARILGQCAWRIEDDQIVQNDS